MVQSGGAMDSRITVRFYSVAPLDVAHPSFEASLKKLMQLGENPSRDLGNEIVIQASHLKEKAGRITGDLVRIQSTNLPSQTHLGKKPAKLTLASGAGLGHHTAFLYDSKAGILAYQITRNSVSLSLFNSYLTAAAGSKFFAFYPVIKASELKQLNTLNAKTFLIKVADPAKLEAVEDEEKKLKESLLNLRTLAEGMYVRVQVGLGNRKGQLDRPRLSNLIRWLLEQKDKKKGAVRTIQVIGKDTAEEDVPLDFIKWQLGGSESLDLAHVDPEENYERRSDFVLECLDKHREELKNYKPD
jgi:hypothetical protein